MCCASTARNAHSALRGRGLDVEQGLAIEYLRGLEPGSLGGIVMITEMTQDHSAILPLLISGSIAYAVRVLRGQGSAGGGRRYADGQP